MTQIINFLKKTKRDFAAMTIWFGVSP